MPLPQPAAPGVYLNELPPNVPHQVTGATTSVAAFPGVFPQGPAGTAVLVQSWDEFVSTYGALTAESSLAALGVWQFFNNGGGSAFIVRLQPGEGMAPATGSIGGVFLTALSEGSVANTWQVSLTANAGDATKVDVATVDTGPSPSVPLETLAALPADPKDLAAGITQQSDFLSGVVDTSGGSSEYTPTPAAVGFSSGVAQWGGVQLVAGLAWAPAATVEFETPASGTGLDLVTTVGSIEIDRVKNIDMTSVDTAVAAITKTDGTGSWLFTSTSTGKWQAAAPTAETHIPLAPAADGSSYIGTVNGLTITTATKWVPLGWAGVTATFSPAASEAQNFVDYKLVSPWCDQPLEVIHDLPLDAADFPTKFTADSKYLTATVAGGSDALPDPPTLTLTNGHGKITSGATTYTFTPKKAPADPPSLSLQAQALTPNTATLKVLAGTSSGGLVQLELLASIVVADPTSLASAVNAGTPLVLARVGGSTTAYQYPPPPVTLAGGQDGTWDVDVLETALLGQVEKGAPLDQIAPAVFNLLCLPDTIWLGEAAQVAVISAAQEFCEEREAFLIVDTPAPGAGRPLVAPSTLFGTAPQYALPPLGSELQRQVFLSSSWKTSLFGANSYSSAAYYPWVEIPNPVVTSGAPPTIVVPPSGTVAGVYATTDATRGVWKAPAGTAATMTGVLSVDDRTMDDELNAALNSVGINCLRTFPIYGNVVWGARTMAGADALGSGWKYVSVRRLADYIEQSLLQSLRWAVFEPNDHVLWAALAMEVNAFMGTLYAQGAFFGDSASAAYQVVCDATTTTAQDILAGIVNVFVGFTPVEPAEFVVLTVQLNAALPAAATS